MATTATARKAPLISGAIHTGADCLVHLIEEEKARAVSCAISELEARFLQFREAAAQSLALANSKCQRLEAKLNESRAQAAASSSAMPSSYVAEETRAARTVATEWKKNLDNLNEALSRAGLEYDNVEGDVQFQTECTTTLLELLDIDREPVPDDTVSPKSFLGLLRINFKRCQLAYLEMEEKCRGLETERDRLKDALQSEVAGLMAQIKALQAEVKVLKSQKPKLVVQTDVDLELSESSPDIPLAPRSDGAVTVAVSTSPDTKHPRSSSPFIRRVKPRIHTHTAASNSNADSPNPALVVKSHLKETPPSAATIIPIPKSNTIIIKPPRMFKSRKFSEDTSTPKPKSTLISNATGNGNGIDHESLPAPKLLIHPEHINAPHSVPLPLPHNATQPPVAVGLGLTLPVNSSSGPNSSGLALPGTSS